MKFAERYRHYDNAEYVAQHPNTEFQCFVEDVPLNAHFRVPTPDDIKAGRSDAFLRNWGYREYKRLKQIEEGTYKPTRYVWEYIVDIVCDFVFKLTKGKLNITPGQKGKPC